MSPPPIPDSLVLEILGHLLPPSPPLPQHLVADALQQRITFLPPSADDLDAWISPLPSSSSQPLTSRLHELAKEHVLGEPEYRHDGEALYARRPLRADHAGVELHFVWEEKPEQEAQWKFHGVFPLSSDDSWARDIPQIHTAPNGEHEQDPADYWANFSPPAETIELADEHQPNEEDYWAQYSSAPSQHHSRPHSPIHPKDRQGSSSSLARPSTSRRPSEHTPSSLTKLSNLNRIAHADTLRPRLLQKIKGSLRRSWLDFAGTDADLEERASEWLSMARNLHRRVGGVDGDAEGIALAKLEVLEEMYTLVEEHEDGFYRLVEEALRTHDQADIGRTYSSDQLGYWE